MPRKRVLLLVTARDGVQTAQLVEPLRAVADQAFKNLHVEGGESRLLVPLDDADAGGDESRRILGDGLSNGVQLGGFDAAVELTLPDGRHLSSLVDGLEEIRQLAGDAIDHSRSAAVAGTDVVIVEGEGPVRLIYGMRRKPGTSHAEFCRYWEKRHTSVTRITPGVVGYRQLHGDLEASKRAAEAAGVALHDIDGVALQWYRSVRELASVVALVGPLVPRADGPVPFREQALSSERRFSDLSRATAIVATEVRQRSRVESS
jgi:hypothetical protein